MRNMKRNSKKLQDRLHCVYSAEYKGFVLYIGCTQDFHKRVAEHHSCAKTGVKSYLYDYMRNFPNNTTFSIIRTFKNKSNAIEFESKLTEETFNMNFNKKLGNTPTRENIDKMVKSVSKPIVQLTQNSIFVNEFNSAQNAERDTGIDHSNISSCCTGCGGRNSAGGFKWVFKSSYNPNVPINTERAFLAI